MKKAEFVSRVAERTGCTKKQTEQILDAVLEEIGDVLSEGDRLNFIGFGAFETKRRAGMTRQLPGAQEPITLPEKNTLVFRPGKRLKEKVEKNET